MVLEMAATESSFDLYTKIKKPLTTFVTSSIRFQMSLTGSRVQAEW